MNYIAGRWVAAHPDAPSLPLLDPATEEPRGALALAAPADAARGAAAARAAFDGGWREVGVAERRALLVALIASLEARRGAFAETISGEIGAPIDFARSHQVEAGIGHLRATLDALDADAVDQPRPGAPEHRVRFEPVGVAALITPWNWPLNQVALKVGGALAAGCAMVLKPSERAPRSGALFAEAMAEAERVCGAPAGLFNMIQGDGVAGAALAADPDVDAVSFTGSTRAGGAVALAAASGFRRVTLELGGKSANLLFADCDLETAIGQGVAHCFRNAGQSCNAASRMLVERPIYEAAVAAAARAAGAVRLGPPDHPGAHLGPLISEGQRARARGLVERAIAAGARCVAGGAEAPEGLERGFYFRPTVLADVAPGAEIAREEVFAPVLAMTPFDTEDDAVALANGTPYGLAAYVQTSDAARADRVARRLRAGMIQINGSSRAPGAPFGGVKASGMGREAGLWGIRAFQEIKSISGAEAI